MKRRLLFVLVAVASAIVASQGPVALGQGNQSLYTRNTMASVTGTSSASFFSTRQMTSQIYNRAVPQNNFSNVNRGLFNAPAAGTSRSKPFANTVGQGSVTPWLALSQPFTSPTTNYFSNVRPQLEQQRMNQQMATRNAQLQHQLNSLAAQAPYDPTGSERMAPTGHVAAYMNYGGYYTPVQPTKGRR